MNSRGVSAIAQQPLKAVLLHEITYSNSHGDKPASYQGTNNRMENNEENDRGVGGDAQTEDPWWLDILVYSILHGSTDVDMGRQALLAATPQNVLPLILRKLLRGMSKLESRSGIHMHHTDQRGRGYDGTPQQGTGSGEAGTGSGEAGTGSGEAHQQRGHRVHDAHRHRKLHLGAVMSCLKELLERGSAQDKCADFVEHAGWRMCMFVYVCMYVGGVMSSHVEFEGITAHHTEQFPSPVISSNST
jgi:hypothetical protein